MKILSLTLSVVVFVVTGYFLVTDFKISTEMNYLIYMSLLVILMLICVIGMLINLPLIRSHKSKVRTLMYNSYSEKRIRNASFDRHFGLS